MSVKVNYKGEEILSVNTDTTKTLKTSGKYCEGDIEVVNTQDGGGGGTLPSTFTRKNFVATGGNAFGIGELTYGIISYEIEFEVRAITTSSQAILGSGKGTADSLLIGTSTGKLGLAGYVNGATVIVPFGTSIAVGDIVTVSGTFNLDTGEKTATFNGETIQTIVSGTNVKYRNISTVGPWYRLHSLKIWRNNQLASNCIPCIHNSDSWGGLFDLNAMRFITIDSSNPAVG